jgi:DNA/RNA endonuclease YhcR with UshA esterase domain
VILALGGTVLLIVMGAQRTVPEVTIDRITPRMAHATISIKGTVTRKPYVSRAGNTVDYLAFTLADDTGTMRVHAYRDTAQALVAAGRLPAAKERVIVSGTVTVSRFGEVRLVLRSVKNRERP